MVCRPVISDPTAERTILDDYTRLPTAIPITRASVNP
jgi:hypothetical protein